MRATAILPVKRFDAAKQRLTDALEPDDRQRLAAAMLADVLAALGACDQLDAVLVVSGDRGAAAAAAAAGASVLDDPNDAGHSQAASIGVRAAMAGGADCVALLPGDCPALETAELDAALLALEPGTVAVIPDRHGAGTNGLLLSPPDAIAPAFGPGSRARHLARAAEAGHQGRALELDSLALDLDTGEDLGALRTWLQSNPGRASATAAALTAIDAPGGDSR